LHPRKANILLATSGINAVNDGQKDGRIAGSGGSVDPITVGFVKG